MFLIRPQYGGIVLNTGDRPQYGEGIVFSTGRRGLSNTAGRVGKGPQYGGGSLSRQAHGRSTTRGARRVSTFLTLPFEILRYFLNSKTARLSLRKCGGGGGRAAAARVGWEVRRRRRCRRRVGGCRPLLPVSEEVHFPSPGLSSR